MPRRRWVTVDTIASRAALRKAEGMTGLVTPTHELPSPEVIEKVILGGDLSQLTPKQRASYYAAVCDSLGLNPLTKPFEFLRLSGREVLYALRNCTDQLRKRYDISVVITARERVDDVYVVTARASLPNGRADESIGAVPVAGLKGEALANAYMKSETKAKRRVTLSLVGLSTLDESEVESIPGAVKIPDPPVLASVDARDPAAAVGAAAVPADLNQQIPETWKPFVASDGDEILRGVVRQVDAETKTNKKGRKFTKTSITLDTGEVVTTLTGTLAATARDCFQRQTPVEIRVQPSRWGKEIVTIAQVAGDDAAF